jgi:hypothetical protein
VAQVRRAKATPHTCAMGRDPVYFDNFIVNDTRGRIIEEDHYYAFGLKIAGISSKKLPDPNEGSIDNKNFYNDKELFDDAELDWYDYGFRNLWLVYNDKPYTYDNWKQKGQNGRYCS